MKILSTNILANHPAYPKIIATYNQILKENGRVNNKNFYETIVLPEIPEYGMSSWYQFLKRFKTEAGIVAYSMKAPMIKGEDGQELAKTMMTNNEAMQKAIASALNISAQTLQDIIEGRSTLSEKDKAELLFKVMKAQDSRVRAIGQIRADNREQEKFDRAFDSAAFS